VTEGLSSAVATPLTPTSAATTIQIHARLIGILLFVPAFVAVQKISGAAGV
jgi:hypothetical protein